MPESFNNGQPGLDSDGHPESGVVSPTENSTSEAAARRRSLPMCAAKVMGFFKRKVSKDHSASNTKGGAQQAGVVPHGSPANWLPSATNPGSGAMPTWHCSPPASPAPALVVYVDRYNHHQVAVYPQDGNHQTALQAVQQGEPPPNLPPSIPLSDDGEFPYAYSQRHLHTSCHFDVNRESVCPPPNRTIHDAESPPSYRSHSVGSVGQLDRSLSSVSSTGSVPNAGRHLDTGTTPVVRCNSMSNNNNKTRNWNIQPPAYSRHDLNAHSPRTVQRPAPGRTHLGHLRVDSSGSNVQYASPPPPSLGQTMPSLSTSSDNATVNANLDVFNNRHSNSNV